MGWLVFILLFLFLLMSLYAVLVRDRLEAVLHERSLFYLVALREHRFGHRCTGGLAVSDAGGILHFGVQELEDDASEIQHG